MNAMRHDLRLAAIWVLVLLILAGCGGVTVNPSTLLVDGTLVPALTELNTPCEACAQATVAAALTQEQNNAYVEAAATAEIEKANSQATLNSANATLQAVQTQNQNNANVVAAQIASTVEIERAAALATLNSAGSTQNAAVTQDAIRQTQVSVQVTSSAEAIVIQQNKNDLAGGTQTAVANVIATQTQSAVATSQWYTDQSRQRAEQRQAPIAFLWMWCPPVFIVLLAVLVLWGFWRWLRIRQANQRILENLVDRLQAPPPEVIDHQRDNSLPYRENDVDIVDGRYQLTKPEDEVHRWLDEVKRKLRSSDEKDEEEDDNSGN